MKNNVLRFIAIAFVFMFGVCLLFPATSLAGEVADSAITVDEVKYIKYETDDCKLDQKAPTYSGVDQDYGYLFGGWYTKTDESAQEKYSPIKDETDKANAGTEIYAKFVPAYVLSIKCQNFAKTTKDSENTAIRIVSSIDSLHYEKIGFDLMKIVKEGDTYTETIIGTDGGQETDTAYNQMAVYNENGSLKSELKADAVFGKASKYFTAWKVYNISNKNFDKTICIRPYWVTLDGTKVYGLAKYAHVEDGLEKYINVPVNLNGTKADVAAGQLSVKYNQVALEFVDAEWGNGSGSVFQEMDYHVDSTNGVVKCVGVVKDISENVSSDRMYINLRFKVKEGYTESLAFDFDVTNEKFSNKEEKLLSGTDYDVWKVKSAFVE